MAQSGAGLNPKSIMRRLSCSMILNFLPGRIEAQQEGSWAEQTSGANRMRVADR